MSHLCKRGIEGFPEQTPVEHLIDVVLCVKYFHQAQPADIHNHNCHDLEMHQTIASLCNDVKFCA